MADIELKFEGDTREVDRQLEELERKLNGLGRKSNLSGPVSKLEGSLRNANGHAGALSRSLGRVAGSNMGSAIGSMNLYLAAATAAATAVKGIRNHLQSVQKMKLGIQFDNLMAGLQGGQRVIQLQQHMAQVADVRRGWSSDATEMVKAMERSQTTQENKDNLGKTAQEAYERVVKLGGNRWITPGMKDIYAMASGGKDFNPKDAAAGLASIPLDWAKTTVGTFAGTANQELEAAKKEFEAATQEYLKAGEEHIKAVADEELKKAIVEKNTGRSQEIADEYRDLKKKKKLEEEIAELDKQIAKQPPKKPTTGMEGAQARYADFLAEATGDFSKDDFRARDRVMAKVGKETMSPAKREKFLKKYEDKEKRGIKQSARDRKTYELLVDQGHEGQSDETDLEKKRNDKKSQLAEVDSSIETRAEKQYLEKQGNLDAAAKVDTEAARMLTETNYDNATMIALLKTMSGDMTRTADNTEGINKSE